jgi:nucleotide-binding universal stress UspA family protein
MHIVLYTLDGGNRKMYKRLLVPLDGSGLAEKALPYALQLTRRLHLETTLLHVSAFAESPSLFMCKSYIEHVAEMLTLQLKENKGKTGLSQGESSGVIRGEAIAGDVPSSILEYAENARADLILMSRHGHSGIGRWLMGSVTHKVLTASKVPVVVIHPDSAESIPEPEWPKTVLVLLDGSKLSETVLPHVEILSKEEQFDVEVTLFEVCEPPDLLSDYPEAIMPLTWDEHVRNAQAASERVCSTRLDEIQRQLEAKKLKVSSKIALGENVIDEIVKYIREHTFDLVAMTTHGRSGISLWPYGHVADRIIQVSSTPLLLVRPC